MNKNRLKKTVEGDQEESSKVADKGRTTKETKVKDAEKAQKSVSKPVANTDKKKGSRSIE